MLRHATPENRADYLCSFCGKQQGQVEQLTTGPGGVSICNECIDLCREVFEEKGTITLLSAESPLFLLCSSCGARCPTPTTTASNAARSWSRKHNYKEV